jgi:hypothetical protein
MGFYDRYKAVFDAIKSVLVYVPAVPEVPAVPAHDDVPEIPAVPGVSAHGIESIKTVIVGEQFSYGHLPKAIINAEPAPIAPAEMGEMLNVSVFFSVILMIQEYEPKDWFADVIKPMGDVVDAVLADHTLGHTVQDVLPVGFAPGEIKFKDKADKLLYGGIVRFAAVLWF